MLPRLTLSSLDPIVQNEITKFDPKKPNRVWIELINNQEFAEIIASYITERFVKDAVNKEMIKAFLHAFVHNMARSGFEKSNFILAINNLTRLPDHYVKDEFIVVAFLIATNLAEIDLNDEPVSLSRYKYFLLAYLMGAEIIAYSKDKEGDKRQYQFPFLGNVSKTIDFLLPYGLFTQAQKSPVEIFMYAIFQACCQDKNPTDFQAYEKTFLKTPSFQRIQLHELFRKYEKVRPRIQPHKRLFKLNEILKEHKTTTAKTLSRVLEPKKTELKPYVSRLSEMIVYFQANILELLNFQPSSNSDQTSFDSTIKQIFAPFPQMQAKVQKSHETCLDAKLIEQLTKLEINSIQQNLEKYSVKLFNSDPREKIFFGDLLTGERSENLNPRRMTI